MKDTPDPAGINPPGEVVRITFPHVMASQLFAEARKGGRLKVYSDQVLPGPDRLSRLIQLPPGETIGARDLALAELRPVRLAPSATVPRALSPEEWREFRLHLSGVSPDVSDAGSLVDIGACDEHDLWRGLVPARTITLLAGAPKGGKSTLLRSLLRTAGAATDTGPRELLSRTVKPFQSLIVTEEPFAAWSSADPCPGTWLRFHKGEPTRTLKEWTDYLKDLALLAEAYGCKVLVLDTISRVCAVDENSPRAVTRVLSSLRDLVNDDGLTVLVVHHTGRSGTVRGSTALEAQVDQVLTLDTVSDDPSDSRRTLDCRGRMRPPCRVEYHLRPDGKLVPGFPRVKPTPSKGTRSRDLPEPPGRG